MSYNSILVPEDTAIKTTLHTTSILSDGYQGLFPWGLKRPGREADHSVPSSTEVKITWNYTSTPPVRLHGVVLN